MISFPEYPLGYEFRDALSYSGILEALTRMEGAADVSPTMYASVDRDHHTLTRDRGDRWYCILGGEPPIRFGLAFDTTIQLDPGQMILVYNERDRALQFEAHNGVPLSALSFTIIRLESREALLMEALFSPDPLTGDP